MHKQNIVKFILTHLFEDKYGTCLGEWPLFCEGCRPSAFSPMNFSIIHDPTSWPQLIANSSISLPSVPSIYLPAPLIPSVPQIKLCHSSIFCPAFHSPLPHTGLSVHLPPVYTASHALSHYYWTFSHHGSSAPLVVSHCTITLLLAETFILDRHYHISSASLLGTFIYLDLCNNCPPVLLIQLKPLCRKLRELALRELGLRIYYE